MTSLRRATLLSSQEVTTAHIKDNGRDSTRTEYSIYYTVPIITVEVAIRVRGTRVCCWYILLRDFDAGIILFLHSMAYFSAMIASTRLKIPICRKQWRECEGIASSLQSIETKWPIKYRTCDHFTTCISRTESKSTGYINNVHSNIWLKSSQLHSHHVCHLHFTAYSWVVNREQRHESLSVASRIHDCMIVLAQNAPLIILLLDHSHPPLSSYTLSNLFFLLNM